VVNSNIRYSSTLTDEQLSALCIELKNLLDDWLHGWGLLYKSTVSPLNRNRILFERDVLTFNADISHVGGVIFYDNLNLGHVKKMIIKSLLLKSVNLTDKDNVLFENLSEDCIKSLDKQLLAMIEDCNRMDCDLETEINVALSLAIKIDTLEFTLQFSDSFVGQFVKNKIKSPRFHKKIINKEFLLDNIELSELNCKLSLQASSISLKQVMSLKVGHVLKLEQAIDRPMVIQINNKPALSGYLVKSDGKKSIYLSGEHNE